MPHFAALKAIPLFVIASLSAPASFHGQFIADHEITLNGYHDEFACVKDEGEWRAGACYFNVADTAFFMVDAEKGLVAEISTVGDNGDECNLEGPLETVDETTAIVRRTLEQGDRAPVTCELSVKALTPSFAEISVEARTPDECAAFCGYHASFSIRSAARFESKARR